MLDFIGEGLFLRGIGGRRRGSTSPLALFAGGVIGVWFDPSDRTTLFEDVAGTIPATLPGQPVGLMLDKSKGLVRGPELVVNGGFDTNTLGWTARAGCTLSSVGGRLRLTFTGTGAARAYTTVPTTPGKFYQVKVTGFSPSGAAPMAYFQTIGSADLASVSLAAAGVEKTFLVSATGTEHRIEVGNSGANTVGAFMEVDNISVRELPGYHATQPVAASRPTLARHPKGGRRNLLNAAEDFTNWTKVIQGTGVTPVVTAGFEAPDGTNSAYRVQLNAGGNAVDDYSLIRQSSFAPPTGSLARSVWIKSNTGANQVVAFVATNATTKVTATTSWQRLSDGSPAGKGQFDLSVGGAGATPATADILVWQPQAEPDAVTPYQKVVSQYDVTEAGVPDCWGLMFDGVDDFLVTPAIDLTATDKVGVFAGVRKLSDATAGAVAELSPNTDVGNGTFGLAAPQGTGVNDFGIHVRSSNGNRNRARLGGYSSPHSAVISSSVSTVAEGAVGAISARVNGQVPSVVSYDINQASTGNFGSYPLYIGRRGGTSLPFNGLLYGLCVAGKLPSAAEITNTETFLNSKMGAF